MCVCVGLYRRRAIGPFFILFYIFTGDLGEDRWKVVGWSGGGSGGRWWSDGWGARLEPRSCWIRRERFFFFFFFLFFLLGSGLNPKFDKFKRKEDSSSHGVGDVIGIFFFKLKERKKSGGEFSFAIF